jgi:hypothetical protein
LTSQRLGGVNFFFITGLTGSSLVDLQNDSHRLRVDDKSAMDSQSTTSDVSLSSTMFLLYKSTLSGFSSQFIPLTVLEFSRHVSEVLCTSIVGLLGTGKETVTS